ncbi:MAG: hypothetical protein K0R67_1222 [Paenibacillus sp.]|nr:hypothetical protein [Paenibacillus sp.]
MVEVIQRYKRYTAEGNRIMLIITNDEDETAAAVFDLALLPALNHFGIPYRVVDRAEGSLTGFLREAAGVVLAHDGVAASLPAEQWGEIVTAAENGVGAVASEYWLVHR